MVRLRSRLAVGLALLWAGGLAVPAARAVPVTVVSRNQTLNKDLIIGATGPAVYMVTKTARFMVQNLTLGNATTGSGWLTLNGSANITTKNTVVGRAGLGSVTVTNGTLFNATGSLVVGNMTKATGTVWMPGGWVTAGAALVVGNLGTGNLDFEGAGGVDAGNVVIGNGGTGLVTANGTGGISAHDFVLGNLTKGNGRLDIGTASSASALSMVIGQNGTGNVTVESGGTLHIGSALVLGAAASGRGGLNLKKGSTLEFYNSSSGSYSGGDGGVVFSNPMDDYSYGPPAAGWYAGNGSATVNWQGGAIHSDSDEVFATVNAVLAPGSTTTLTVGGGLEWSGNLSGGGGVDVAGGELDLEGGNNTFSGGIQVEAGATLYLGNRSNTGSGPVSIQSGATLAGAGTVTGPATVFGTLIPGFTYNTYGELYFVINVPGNTTFTQGLVLSGASIPVTISGTMRGLEYPGINVVGNCTLDGELQVTLDTRVNTPLPGDEYELIQVSGGTLSGNFSTLDLPQLPNGEQWDGSRLATQGILAVAAGPEGWTVENTTLTVSSDMGEWPPTNIPLTVGANATLSGSGEVPLAATVNGSLQPSGPMTFDQGLTLGANATTTLDSHRMLTVTGNLVLNGNLVINLNYAQPGDVMQLFRVSHGTVSGAFTTITASYQQLGIAWDFSQLETNGTITAVSVPAAYAPLTVGAGQTLTLNGSGNTFGMTTVAAGGVLNSNNGEVRGALTIAQGGAVNGALAVDGNLYVETGVYLGYLNSGCAISSGGTAFVDGNITITDTYDEYRSYFSARAVELGPNATLNFNFAFDQLGTASQMITPIYNITKIDGVLNVYGDSLRVPHSGDTLQLFTLAGATGTFSQVQLQALPSGLTWDVSALYTNGTITVSGPAEVEGVTPHNPLSQLVYGSEEFLAVQAQGDPAPSYQWQVSVDGGDTWQNATEGGNISGTATEDLSFYFLSYEQDGASYRCGVTNGIGPVQYTDPVTFRIWPSGYTTWQYEAGLQPNEAPQDFGFGDGITNLWRFALGVTSGAATDSALPQYSQTKVKGVVSDVMIYRVSTDGDGILVTPQQSTDGKNWTNVAAKNITQAWDYNTQSMKYTVAVPEVSRKKVQLRVVVDYAPAGNN